MQLSEQFTKFVTDHRKDDVVKLRLKYHGKEPWIEKAVTHIQSLQKAGRKFIDPVTGEDFTPALMLMPLSVEQATSAAVARRHQELAHEGDKILDMTCGLGIDSMMFARLPGVQLTTCELNPVAARAARHNFSGMQNVTVVEGDSVEFLRNFSGRFDMIFIDPARRDSAGGRVYNIRQCTPDITGILPLMLAKADRLLIKLSPMIDITQTARDLAVPCRIYAVDDGHECKELLVEIGSQVAVAEEIVVLNGDKKFSFSREEESAATVTFADEAEIVPGKWLYEPSPAAMRAAPFRLLSDRFGLKKLHTNTHLYLSDNDADAGQFPGAARRIVDVIELTSGAIKQLHKRYPQLNLAVRNYPSTPEEFLKKAKIRQGGTLKGFAVSTLSRRFLIVC
ncbi:MAG: class I SAM-dependent methyltransferase [Muribaculaceae bacterium]|nr:class I SAM-dependent methyltransferase [Muribaculaceae bacterium]